MVMFGGPEIQHMLQSGVSKERCVIAVDEDSKLSILSRSP